MKLSRALEDQADDHRIVDSGAAHPGAAQSHTDGGEMELFNGSRASVC